MFIGWNPRSPSLLVVGVVGVGCVALGSVVKSP